MLTNENPTKVYDLEARTFIFATEVRAFIKSLKANESNIEDKKQLIRSSGSVAANYIEANEAISKKDFALRIKISRKEAKESHLWLRLLQTEVGIDGQSQVKHLIQESLELAKIFGAIANKCGVKLQD